MLEILQTEIRILVLKAQSPMVVERVLQAAADHPPESSIAVAPAVMKGRAVLNNSLFKVDVAHCAAASHIRHPPAQRVTDPPAESREIMRSKSSPDTVIRGVKTWEVDQKRSTVLKIT